MKLNRSFQWILSIVSLLAAGTGCSSVTLRQPLPRVADAAEMAAFEGEWLSEGQVLYLRFGADGTGRLAGLEWRDDRFVVEEGEFVISKEGDRGYLSVRLMENGKWLEGYYLVQYRFTGQQDLILWLPDVAAFADAVVKKKLDGLVDKGSQIGSVVITSPPDKVLAYLNDPGNASLFDYREPMVVKKLLLSPPSPEVEAFSLPEEPALQ